MTSTRRAGESDPAPELLLKPEPDRINDRKLLAQERVADAEALKMFDDWDKRPKIAPAVIIPDGENEQADFDINAMLEASAVESAAQAERIKTLRDSEYHSYVKCRYHGPGESDIGIYLTHMPGEGEVLGMTDWFSRYKPKPNEMYLGEIVCQVCFQNGVERSLEVEMVGRRGQFKVPERMLWRRPRDPKRLAAEGPTRARAGRSPSSNQGREDAMARSVARGMERVD